MDFSLFYFSSVSEELAAEKYLLVLEGAKFADANGFTAVWTPERHFQPFGGLFPNPSVMSAALATITKRVHLRAGSVVLPLHDPLRVAEEWSVVDNLAGEGRIGLALASGWHPDDYVFSPEAYTERKQVLYDSAETFKKLWRGESIRRRNGAGQENDFRILPRPVTAEVPLWITVIKDPDSYVNAGKIGANILTNLLSQSLEELEQNIAVYRAARARYDHNPESGQVTLLLHTYLGDDLMQVKEQVRLPFYNYLRSSASAFSKAKGRVRDLSTVSPAMINELLANSFERYFNSGSLMGTVESCSVMVERLKAVGVTEIGCMIDFGVDTDAVLQSLPRLNQLRKRFVAEEARAAAGLA